MNEKRGKSGYRRQKGEKKGNFPLTTPQIQKLLDSCDPIREKLIFFILLNLGFRVSDLVRMTKKDIDFKFKTYRYVSKKTNKEVYVPLNDRTIELMNKYCRIHSIEDRLFPISTGRIWQIINKIKKRAKIKRKVSAHDFCCTAITRLSKKKVPIEAICLITGRSEKTVRKWYQKFDVEDLREFMNGANMIPERE